MTSKRNRTQDQDLKDNHHNQDLKKRHQKEMAREQRLADILAELTASTEECEWLAETDAPCLLAEQCIKSCITYELEYIVRAVESQLHQLKKALHLETLTQVHILTVLTDFPSDQQTLLQPWMEQQMLRCTLFLDMAARRHLMVAVHQGLPMDVASQALTAFLRQTQPNATFTLDIMKLANTILITHTSVP